MNIITEKLDDIYLLESNTFINELIERDICELQKILTESSNVVADKLVTATKKNISVAKQFLADNGINVNRLTSEAKTIGRLLQNDLKKRRSASEIQSRLLKKSSTIILKEVQTVKEQFTEKDLTEKILMSVIILFITIFVSSLIDSITSLLFFRSPGLHELLGSLIIAPLIEEYAKKYAILEDYPWIYTGIFSGVEMILYVFKWVRQGALIGPSIILRLAGVLLHFATTFVQKYFYDKYEKQERKSQNLEPDIDDVATTGYFLGVFMHFTWNLLATVAGGATTKYTMTGGF